jgi:hypothetical protein
VSVLEGKLKSATSLMPPGTGLSATQFLTLKSAGLNYPEVPEKYNKTEVKNGATLNHINIP